MKSTVIFGLAVAVLALGPAAAQPPTDHGGGGVNMPPTTDFSPYYYRLPYSNAPEEAIYRRQVKAYNMACRAERHAVCEGRRSAGAVWTCIRIRRSKLPEPCRAATYAVERAAADANYRSWEGF